MDKPGHVSELYVQEIGGMTSRNGEISQLSAAKTQVSKITLNSGIPWHAIVRLLPDEGGCLTRRADILSAKSAGSPQDESVRLADWKPCQTIQVRHGESVLRVVKYRSRNAQPCPAQREHHYRQSETSGFNLFCFFVFMSEK
jgi:hypothetical protein